MAPNYTMGQPGDIYMKLPTDQIVNVLQTAGQTIVQADPTIKPYRLVPVDEVATLNGAAVQLLKAFEPDWSRDRVINDIQLANQGGSAFQTVDPVSQSEYGPRTYQRLDFLNDDSHPEYLVERTNDYLEGWTEAQLRVNAVTFTPDAGTYAWAMSLFMGDLVRVRYQHPVNGWGFALVTHIQGYVHALTPNGWTTTLNLDQPTSFAYWDKPPTGGLGWDIDLWDDGIWDNPVKGAVYWSSGQRWSDAASKWMD
jgi:hypothetical protein